MAEDEGNQTLGQQIENAGTTREKARDLEAEAESQMIEVIITLAQAKEKIGNPIIVAVHSSGETLGRADPVYILRTPIFRKAVEHQVSSDESRRIYVALFKGGIVGLADAIDPSKKSLVDQVMQIGLQEQNNGRFTNTTGRRSNALGVFRHNGKLVARIAFSDNDDVNTYAEGTNDGPELLRDLSAEEIKAAISTSIQEARRPSDERLAQAQKVSSEARLVKSILDDLLTASGDVNTEEVGEPSHDDNSQTS